MLRQPLHDIPSGGGPLQDAEPMLTVLMTTKMKIGMMDHGIEDPRLAADKTVSANLELMLVGATSRQKGRHSQTLCITGTHILQSSSELLRSGQQLQKTESEHDFSES
jgi:hypothetical protein